MKAIWLPVAVAVCGLLVTTACEVRAMLDSRPAERTQRFTVSDYSQDSGNDGAYFRKIYMVRDKKSSDRCVLVVETQFSTDAIALTSLQWPCGD